MFPTLTTHNAYELFYSHLGQHALSVANYWYDPMHRDLYLKYSIYLAVIDNVKPQETNIDNFLNTIDSYDDSCDTILTKSNFSNTSTDCLIIQSNNNTIKLTEERVVAAIAAVNTATVKVERHNDANNSNIESFTTGTTIKPNVLANNTDHYYLEDNNSSAKTNIRKIGLTRLQKIVLIGGPDDGVISPWQSRCVLKNIHILLL